MRALRPIGHDDRLSVVDHLDELRSRLFICFGVLLAAFCLCFWQNGALINVLNRALPRETTAASHSGLAAQAKQAADLHKAFQELGQGARELELGLSLSRGISPATSKGAAQIVSAAKLAERSLPKSAPKQELPLTIGVGESFTTTLLVVGYFSLLFSLPVILYQLFAYMIPALNPSEKRVAVPTMFVAP